MPEGVGLRSARMRQRTCLYLVLIVGLQVACGRLIFQMGREVLLVQVLTPSCVLLVGISLILVPRLAFDLSRFSISAVLSLVYVGLKDLMLLVCYLSSFSSAKVTAFLVPENGNITTLEVDVYIAVSEVAVTAVLFMACIKRTCKTRYLLALLGGALGIHAILLPKVLETLAYVAVACAKGDAPDICRAVSYCEVALSESVALIALFVVVLSLPEWGSPVVKYLLMSKAFRESVMSETSKSNNTQQYMDDTFPASDRSAEVPIRSSTRARSVLICVALFLTLFPLVKNVKKPTEEHDE